MSKILVLALLATGLLASEFPNLEMVNLAKRTKGSTNNENSLHFTIQFSSDISITAEFSATTKGNGVVKIANTAIQNYDNHDDTITYRNGILIANLIDLDGDGVKELLLKGIADYHHEKEDRIAFSIPIVSIWKLRSDKSGLEPLYKDIQIHHYNTK